MINQQLLDKVLKEYKDSNRELKPLRYNRDFIFNLFRKYKCYGVTEESFCCYGEEQCCWYDVIRDGTWDYTPKKIKQYILRLFNLYKNDLRSTKDGNRMYVYKDDRVCIIYIYLRDSWQCDYYIWFSN